MSAMYNKTVQILTTSGAVEGVQPAYLVGTVSSGCFSTHCSRARALSSSPRACAPQYRLPELGLFMDTIHTSSSAAALVAMVSVDGLERVAMAAHDDCPLPRRPVRLGTPLAQRFTL